MAGRRPSPGGLENAVAAVILDRDGTLIEEIGHLNRPQQIQPIPGAARAVRILEGHRG